MNRLRWVWFLLPLLAAFGQGDRTRPKSPEIEPDGRVTIRLLAPQATEVKLWGDWITQSGATQALTKDSDGVWSATVGPLAPGLHIYSLRVDGLSTPDPGNPRVRAGRSGVDGNLFLIPGKEPAPDDLRDVPHGTLHVHSYTSTTGLGPRRVVVYTPPGYEKDTKRRYPVLFLLHGSGDNEAGWSDEVGRANLIADNLIATGASRPMIVVMPNGHARGPEAPRDSREQSFDLFERDLLADVMPLVDRVYRTARGPRNRAVAGLSMGGYQALTLGVKHTNLFSGIGVFSAGLANEDSGNLLREAASNGKLAKNVGVFWVGIGDQDRLLKSSRSLESVLSESGVRHTYKEIPGHGHTWVFWRQCLAEFLPLLFNSRAEKPGAEPGGR